MSLASVSIRNPVFAWMLMAGFIIFGVIAFCGPMGVKKLAVGQYPDIDFPNITVTATLEGAAPEIMETDVVDVLEDAVMAVEGIREMTSVCKQGQATITLEFELSREIDVALQDVQARISQANKQLPKDMDPVIINKVNPEEQPIMWVALSGTRSQSEISEYAKNVLRDRFLTVEGNGDVMMGGYLQRNVRIWIDASKLEALGLGADDLLKAATREHVEVPAGRLEGTLRESNVQVEGEALNLEQMKHIVVAVRNGSPIYLQDVAIVEDGFEDRRRIARANGFPAQGLGIIKQHGSNTVEVADSVRKRIAELQKGLPDGLKLDVRVDNSKFIKDAVHEIELTLVLAVLLTAVVCWFFLGSISSTFNVLLAIPVSVCGTFAVMYFCGFSLNTFTLLALSLSVGIVVDDAVMVLENIYRHAEMGKDKVTAAREGTEQISFAALSATMAIIAIFLPVAFMSGIIGKFFFQFGVVLSVAVAISLLEALTLAPARCAQFLKVGHRGNIVERFAGHIFDFLTSSYRTSLKWMLEFRNAYLAVPSLVVLILCSMGMMYVLSLAGMGLIRGLSGASLEEKIPGLIFIGVVGVMLFGLVACIGYFAASLARPKQTPVASILVMMGAAVMFMVSTLYVVPMSKEWEGRIGSLSRGTIGTIPQELIPQQDQGYYMVRVTAPVGSTVDYTDKVMRHVEGIMATHNEFESNLVIAGGIGGDVNVGIAFVTLKPYEERHANQDKIVAAARKDLEAKGLPREKIAEEIKKIKARNPASQQESMDLMRTEVSETSPSPGSRVVIVDFSQAGFASSKRGGLSIEYSIRGPDMETLGSMAEAFMDEMKSSGAFVDVDTDFRKGMPEIAVLPNREKALSLNVDMKTLADTVGILIGGQKVGKFKDHGRRYDVRARLLESSRGRPEDIGRLYIRSKDGKLVRISDVATITTRPSLQSITRQDRERAVTMMANPAPGHSQDEARQTVERIAGEKLPEGYSIRFSGSTKAMLESRNSLLLAMGLGVIVAYMILASQFNSFLHPVTILLALPFSVSGALAALYLTRQSLNIYSLIGLILLMGIVKKNSILLVDYTNQLRNEGKSRFDALVEACPTRLRAILMTTVATIAGAIPGAVMTGPGSELRIPMSVAVIGGLTLSTLLTLFIVPCFYNLADDVKVWLWGLFGTAEPKAEPQAIADVSAAGK